MTSMRQKFSKITEKANFKLTDGKGVSDKKLIQTMIEIEMLEITSEGIKDARERKEIEKEVYRTKRALKEEYKQLATSNKFLPIEFEIQKDEGIAREEIELGEISLDKSPYESKKESKVPDIEVRKDVFSGQNLEWSKWAEELLAIDVIKNSDHFANTLWKLKCAEFKAKEDYVLQFANLAKRMDSLRDRYNISQKIREILYTKLKEDRQDKSFKIIKSFLEDVPARSEKKGVIRAGRVEIASFRQEIDEVSELSKNLKKAIEIVQNGLDRYKGARVEKEQIQDELNKLYEPAMLDTSDTPNEVLKNHLVQFVSMLQEKKNEVHKSHIEGSNPLAKVGLWSSNLESELDKIIKDLRKSFNLPVSQKPDVSSQVSKPKR